MVNLFCARAKCKVAKASDLTRRSLQDCIRWRSQSTILLNKAQVRTPREPKDLSVVHRYRPNGVEVADLHFWLKAFTGWRRAMKRAVGGTYKT